MSDLGTYSKGVRHRRISWVERDRAEHGITPHPDAPNPKTPIRGVRRPYTVQTPKEERHPHVKGWKDLRRRVKAAWSVLRGHPTAYRVTVVAVHAPKAYIATCTKPAGAIPILNRSDLIRQWEAAQRPIADMFTPEAGATGGPY